MKVMIILPLVQKPTRFLEKLKKNSVMKNQEKTLPIRHIDLALGTPLILGDIMVPISRCSLGPAAPTCYFWKATGQ